MKKFVKVICKEKEICAKCELANHVVSRFMGLMFRKNMDKDAGLILIPCNEIHTFNMKFDIDVITLDKDDVVISIFDSVPPGKVKKAIKGGKKVLELNSGVAKDCGISCGDKLEFLSITKDVE